VGGSGESGGDSEGASAEYADETPSFRAFALALRSRRERTRRINKAGILETIVRLMGSRHILVGGYLNTTNTARTLYKYVHLFEFFFFQSGSAGKEHKSIILVVIIKVITGGNFHFGYQVSLPRVDARHTLKSDAAFE
jgi:hypothetical protein